MLPFPQNQQFQPGMGDFNPMFNYPTFAPSPMTFNRNIITNNRNIYSAQGFNSNQIINKQQFHGYTKINNYNLFRLTFRSNLFFQLVDFLK